jgi:hypothetical protein
MGLHRRQLHMLTYSDEEHAKTDEKAGIDKNACRLEIAGKREKAVFKSKLFITGYFVCYERFFRTRSYKVFIFIKFLIPPRKCSKALMTILADWQNSVLSMSFTPYRNKISDQSCVLS